MLGNPTYQAGLLGSIFMGSLTDDFTLTFIRRIPQTLQNDGTFILWLIGNNIRHNNVAFTEYMSEKIANTTLGQIENDVIKYLINVKNNLHMIGHISMRVAAAVAVNAMCGMPEYNPLPFRRTSIHSQTSILF
jgi:hypothetical protein